MTCIKQKFILLNFFNKFLPVNIIDGTQAPISSNGVVQTTPSLILTDVQYVPKFPVSLLSISQFTIFSLCVSAFQDLSTGRRIGSGHERGGMFIWTTE